MMVRLGFGFRLRRVRVRGRVRGRVRIRVRVRVRVRVSGGRHGYHIGHLQCLDSIYSANRYDE